MYDFFFIKKKKKITHPPMEVSQNDIHIKLWISLEVCINMTSKYMPDFLNGIT